MIELNDVVLEVVVGGGHRRGGGVKNTNKSIIKLWNFEVEGDGGLNITVIQSIG